jgi:hypothetical protein
VTLSDIMYPAHQNIRSYQTCFLVVLRTSKESIKGAERLEGTGGMLGL